MSDERRLAFGKVADLYDRARPSYPSQLVDDVLAFAAVGAGDRALDVGAGTGKATELFAARGLRVLGLEPSPAMAGVARRRLAAWPEVTIEETDLEHWRPERREFKLVFSAQAWHWVAPEVAYARTRDALHEGGTLAVFWNRPLWRETRVREQLDEVYARVVPDLVVKPGPMHPGAHESAHWMTDWDPQRGSEAGFCEPEARDYSWRASYTTQMYVELLQTHSDHATLPRERRDVLLQEVAAVIDSSGGRFELPYTTRLLLSRLRTRSG
jgi:SAM-dependent methyltransferase